MDYFSWRWQQPLYQILRTEGQPNLNVSTQGLPTEIWKESLAIPFATALLFLCIQTIHGLATVALKWKRGSADGEEQLDESGIWLQRRIKDAGGIEIFAYEIARLLGCLSLFSMSVASVRACTAWRKHGDLEPGWRVFLECPELFAALTYGYSSILAMISVSMRRWSVLATRYNIALLLVLLGTYLYRDVWPLATSTQTPVDVAEGKLLWAKIAVLVFTALVVPLFIPRQYIPVDPKDPMPVTNDEHTCSLISLALYTYLDPVIFLGAKVAHLKFDQLPPIMDTDYSKNLTKRAFPHIDPFERKKRRHIFFGLMRVYRTEFSTLALLICIMVGFSFASPIAVYQILSYLEVGHAGESNVKPWFWIFCMFLGPAGRAITFQWYIFIQTRTLVRTEGLITQLVFAHSLRIRLKAETSTEKKDEDGNHSRDASSTVAGTPETASIAESTSPNSEAGSSTAASTAVSREPSTAASTTSTLKGKGKGPVKAADAPKKDDTKEKSKSDSNLIGKINNLVTTDLNNIVSGRDFLLLILSVPLQITLCITFLYRILGWSAFVGLGSMIALIPLPGYIAKLLQDVQRARMKKTDARVQDVTEAVNVLRMVKLFGWETKMATRIEEKRNEELKALWKLKCLETINGILNFVIPTISMIATYAAYTVIMREELTPAKIFSSIAVFNMLRQQLNRISWQVSLCIQGKVSLDRVNEFLLNTELLDAFTPSSPESSLQASVPLNESAIGFNNAIFSWSADSPSGSMTPSSRNFRLSIHDEVLFKPGCINMIVGPTGSGKTSILMALLGEMHFIPTTPDSWFNLPRKGGVAYAAQESWVQNATIRDNILFGSPYDEVRYRKVIKQCALEKDLELFEAGDQTEVGEKGLTLSGGQKARVTLARAIYSPAEILLLDDILAALDVHTSAWIVEKCFRGDLVKGRTVLLVTHNVALVTPVAKFIISIDQDGRVTSRGQEIEETLSMDPQLAAEAERDFEALVIGQEEVPELAHKPPPPPKDGKLIIAEEIEEGHVTWKSLKLFLSALGGNHPLVFYTLWVLGLLLTDWSNSFQTWFLGYWGSQYEKHPAAEVKESFYLTAYSLILLTATLVYTAAYIFFIYASMRASRHINKLLVNSVLWSTLRWLDETPTARIITRCTQDMRAVDGWIPQGFSDVVEISMSLVSKLGIIIIFSPPFLAPGVAVAALGLYLGNLYLKAQLSVKREMSNARSPLLAHFSAAISGIVSVRAYGAEHSFKQESLKRIDHYTRIARMSYNLNRWIGIRIEFMGAAFTSALAAYLVYGKRQVGAANTGFSLNMAIDFCTMLLWWVRIFNEFEVQANSLERIQGYVDIEHEPKPVPSGEPPAAWPTSGSLRVENLSARYSQTGPVVLHNLSFEIKSGQRVGIVGRTGSGKSSLTLALLRCIVTEGNVFFDGILTSSINLDALRSSMTIIPQIPELLSGTLRKNLDPFDQHDDATLNDALRDAGLFALQDELDEARITLDSSISAGGSNLSVGQRQILALARAMVRGSKLLILDEATSAIDYKTDSTIQATLRHRLASDVTIITVAHRLQTIMDADKIMVLDAGHIVEFDSPAALLEKDGGILKAMVDDSGDAEMLYGMAKGQ